MTTFGVANVVVVEQPRMVAPRFTKACADLLRKSWSELPETFTKEVFERVLAEDKEVYELLSHPVVKEFQNMRKVISRFLGLLEPEATLTKFSMLCDFVIRFSSLHKFLSAIATSTQKKKTARSSQRAYYPP